MIDRAPYRQEVYRVTTKPGGRPDLAAMRLAVYIVDRWLPDHAGGVHILITPTLAEAVLPFFTRPRPVTLVVDTQTGITPTVYEAR